LPERKKNISHFMHAMKLRLKNEESNSVFAHNLCSARTGSN